MGASGNQRGGGREAQGGGGRKGHEEREGEKVAWPCTLLALWRGRAAISRTNCFN